MKHETKSNVSEPLDLAEEIHALTTHLRKVNSPKRRLWMGVLGGLGGVIGATMLAAPLFYLISKLLTPFGVYIPGA